MNTLNVGRQHRLLQRRNDKQNHVRSVRTRLPNLVGGNDEILAQHGDIHAGTHGVQIGERAIKAPLLCEHRNSGSSTGLVGFGECGRIRDGGQGTL